MRNEYACYVTMGAPWNRLDTYFGAKPKNILPIITLLSVLFIKSKNHTTCVVFGTYHLWC